MAAAHAPPHAIIATPAPLCPYQRADDETATANALLHPRCSVPRPVAVDIHRTARLHLLPGILPHPTPAPKTLRGHFYGSSPAAHPKIPAENRHRGAFQAHHPPLALSEIARQILLVAVTIYHGLPMPRDYTDAPG